MKWHSLYQSVSHSVTAVVPEYLLPLRPDLLHTAVALPLGNFHSSSSCLWVPFAPSPAFISTLQAVPFQSIISSPPTLALWERGKEGSILRGVEFFYHSWHPWRSVTRHFALSFTLFFSPSSQLSPLKLPSSTSLWKATLVFPANLLLFSLSSSWSFHLSVRIFFCHLECLAEVMDVEPVWEPTKAMKGQELNGQKNKGIRRYTCVFYLHAYLRIWEAKDKIG